MADIYSILAGKGRGEDKHIRKVFGEPSHVNEVEKDAIDIYGLLGEIFTKKVGTGDTNPNSGLPEYDYKKNILGKRKKSKNSPHNKSHDKFKKSGGQQGKHPRSHKTGAELNIERQQAQTTAQGAALLDPAEGSTRLDPETGLPKTIGEMGLGQEALTAEQYQGMTPEQIVNDIFAKQYNSQVPPEMQKQGVSEADFKAEIAGRLKNMPQFKGVDPEELEFQQEAKDLAGRRTEASWDATKYGLQGQASKIAGAMGSGTGVGMRGAIAGQQKIGQGFGAGLEARDIALDTADLGYREGVYGLEQAAGAEWETDYSSFLGTLPSPA